MKKNIKNDKNVKIDVEVAYEILYGPEKKENRRSLVASDEKEAVAYFRKKEKAGFHVDVYKIESVHTKTKLTVEPTPDAALAVQVKAKKPKP